MYYVYICCVCVHLCMHACVICGISTLCLYGLSTEVWCVYGVRCVQGECDGGCYIRGRS